MLHLVAIHDVLELLEQYLGSASAVGRFLVTGRTFYLTNSLYLEAVGSAWEAYQACMQWVIDQHYWSVLAREAVDRWECERYRFEDDVSD